VRNAGEGAGAGAGYRIAQRGSRVAAEIESRAFRRGIRVGVAEVAERRVGARSVLGDSLRLTSMNDVAVLDAKTTMRPNLIGLVSVSMLPLFPDYLSSSPFHLSRQRGKGQSLFNTPNIYKLITLTRLW
jgi:hypothetical protein